MDARRRVQALAGVVFLLPAELFLGALVARSFGTPTGVLAGYARLIVLWFAHRPHVGLWLLLITLPGAAFALGLAELAGRLPRSPSARPRDVITWIAAGETIVAGVILAIVGLHVLAT